MTLYVFGYGSLPVAPEFPELLVAKHRTRLRGYRRCFNKRSSARHCTPDESFAAFDDEWGFLRDGYFHSLMLGTVPAANHFIDALTLQYPESARSEVLAAIDRREGYDAARDTRLNGYLRYSVTVEQLDGSDSLRAEVYLSNNDPGCAFSVPAKLSVEDRARVLINATPRRPAAEQERRGLYYLERVRANLRQHALVDDDLEALAAAIGALDGPWRQLVR